MFGMSLPEILVIAVVAVVFLGPEKLPSTMVQIAKFFKLFKKTVNDAKNTFDQEMKIQELKEDAKKYKESFSQTAENAKKKLTFEELDAIKNQINGVNEFVEENINDVKKTVEDIKNPQNLIKDSLMGDKKEV